MDERAEEDPFEHEVKGVDGWRKSDLYGAGYDMHFLMILVPMHELHQSFSSVPKTTKSYQWNSENLVPYQVEYGRYTVHK